jgi:hypothetical protein
MTMNLTPSVRTVRVMNAVAAGTTDQESTAVDTAGFEGCRFVAALGSITSGAVTSMRVEQSADGSTGWAALAGASVTIADDDDNELAIIDVRAPRQRYLRAVIDRGTQNAVIDGVVAELYGPRTQAVPADASVAGQAVLNGPAPA